MERSNFWAKLATALITLSLAGGAFVVTSCGEDEKIETPDNPDDKPDNPDDKPDNPDDKPDNPDDNPDNPDDKPGDETTTATVTLSMPNVDGATVTWTGKLTVTGTGTVEAGVSYSEYDKPNVTDDPAIVTVQKAGTPDPDGNFTVTVSGLIKDHTYYYCSYYKIDGKYTFGDVIEFKTGGNVYDEEADIDMTKAEDLSASETANCYIVTKAGTYKFKAVKGNDQSQTLAGANAEILWESFCTDEKPEKGSIVSGIKYKDGYVGFTTPATYTKGNVLVALKDASGTILWSWHIWMTDKPQGQTYKNNAGVMMDRNLGATSATPGDATALGLLYQWGRKDPFLGSSSISENTPAESTISWPSAVTSYASVGTIDFAIANPTTFITWNSSTNSDWYFTGSSPRDDTRWQSSKTIYDPCPAGWRVPDGGESGVWTTAFGTTSEWTTLTNWDSTNRGMDFSKTDKTLGSSGPIWYPAAGCRDHGSGDLTYVGRYGRYWTVTPYGKPAYYLFFDNYGLISPPSNYYRASAQSVRCIEE